jgi:hypothetical protein
MRQQNQDDQQADRTRVQVDDRERTDDPDRSEFHEPAPLPTTFGAPTVGGAVAASALASEERSAELDARDDETVGPDNGRTDGQTSDTRTAMGRATPGTDTAYGAGPLVDPQTTERLRAGWRDMQVRFVDDPQAALGEARGLVGEAVESLTSALTEQRERLDNDGDGHAGKDVGPGETERIRLAIRRYRDFLDRVLDR